MNYTDEKLFLDIDDKKWPVLIRTPEKLADNPALMINLGSTVQIMLDSDPYSFVSNPFTEAGHYTVTYNLPYHGELLEDRSCVQLSAMARAHSEGKRAFGLMADVAAAVFDLAIERGYVNADRIFAAGVSRGALSAMHVAAADKRVQACAGVAPVTHLPALREWGGMEDVNMVKRESAMSLLDALVDRPLYMVINDVDERVDAEQCKAFAQAVNAAGGNATLKILDAEGHGCDPMEYRYTGEWLLAQVQ